MYLYSKLEAFKKEIHIALIGCGKFITMFLAQLNNLNNIKVNTIVDLDISKAKDNCIKSGLSKSIINDIKINGDSALYKYAKKFDRISIKRNQLKLNLNYKKSNLSVDLKIFSSS